MKLRQRRQANDMSLYKRGGKWWMEFVREGQRYRRSTRLSSRREAEKIEDAFKTQLEKAEVGIEDRKPVPTLRVFSQQFADYISTRHAEKPQTADFYAK